MTRLVLLTDVVTPYMDAVLAALGERLELCALFCAESGSRSGAWLSGRGSSYESRVIHGVVVPRRSPNGTDYYPDPRILKAIAHARPEVIVSAGFSFPTGYAAAYAKARRVPLLIYSDGTSVSEAGFGRAQLAARAVLLRAADGALALSEASRRRFEELGVRADRVFLARHTTAIEPLHDVGRARRYRPSRGLELLGVGRLIPKKGFDLLIGSVAAARETGVDVRLTLAGSGPQQAALQQLANDLDVPVAFRGFVEPPELKALYVEADAFAFPSRREPFGIALLEAAASGLPMIGSPFAGATEELVLEGETGFVVEPGDTQGWIGALRMLAEDPPLRERFGRRAHESTLDRVPAATADAYVRAIHAVTGGASGAQLGPSSAA